MKILSIGARGIPDSEGGAEKNAENIFPLIARRHSVTLLCLDKFVTNESYKGVRIVAVPTFRVLGTDKLYYYLYAVAYVWRHRPDIVHCQGLNAALFLSLYRLCSKVVARYGSADYLNAKWGTIGRIGFHLCEWQLSYADAVIAVTDSLKSRLVNKLEAGRVWVIPNAVDSADDTGDESVLADHGLEAGKFILGVGRVTAQKDFATLLEAYSAVHLQRPDIGPLVIAGGDDGSGYICELTAMEVDGVVFTGKLPRSKVRALFRTSRLYVNSSRHEGQSNAILEAVSCRTPIIASRIPENLDLPLGSHQFFAVGEAEDLARIILDAYDNPSRFAETDPSLFWNWDDVANATMKVYEGITREAVLEGEPCAPRISEGAPAPKSVPE
jgi:glycosyltransferase involved in cell wall biosynthesis